MTPQLGIRVMLSMIFGDADTPVVLRSAIGKTVSNLELKDNKLQLEFSDGTGVCIFDDGQTCCEYRYITTDDDLGYYIGSSLTDIEVADGSSIEVDGEWHETQFLRVATSAGMFVCETHNEHNGYYGGFCLVARVATSGTGDG